MCLIIVIFAYFGTGNETIWYSMFVIFGQVIANGRSKGEDAYWKINKTPVQLMEGTHVHKLSREETLIRHVQKTEGIHSNIWPCSFGREYTHADPSYRTNSNTTTRRHTLQHLALFLWSRLHTRRSQLQNQLKHHHRRHCWVHYIHPSGESCRGRLKWIQHKKRHTLSLSISFTRLGYRPLHKVEEHKPKPQSWLSASSA